MASGGLGPDMESAPVRMAGAVPIPGDDDLRGVADEAFTVNGDVTKALHLAVALGVSHAGAGPGSGRTQRLFDTLATVAAADLTAARVVEAHLDALSILEQSPEAGAEIAVGSPDTPTWGVFASRRAGPGRAGASTA